MYISDINQEIDRIINKIIDSGQLVASERLGLDSRADGGCMLYLIADGIVAMGNARNLEYYGGFEYVDREDVTKIGNLTIYSDECDRVQECIAFHYESSLA